MKNFPLFLTHPPHPMSRWSEQFRGCSHWRGPPPLCSVGDGVQTCSRCQRTWPRPTWSLRCGRGWAPAGWSETWGWAPSQPAFCGVERERKRDGGETEERARGTARQGGRGKSRCKKGVGERWGAVEEKWRVLKQHKHGTRCYVNQTEEKVSFIMIIKSYIYIIILNTVHRRNKHLLRKSQVEQFAFLPQSRTKSNPSLISRRALWFTANTDSKGAQINSKPHRIFTGSATDFVSLWAAEREKQLHEKVMSPSNGYMPAQHSLSWPLKEAFWEVNHLYSLLDLFNFREAVNYSWVTHFQVKNELVSIPEVEKVHVEVKWVLPALITARWNPRVWENSHIQSFEGGLSANVLENYFWSCGISFSGRGGRTPTKSSYVEINPYCSTRRWALNNLQASVLKQE